MTFSLNLFLALPLVFAAGTVVLRAETANRPAAARPAVEIQAHRGASYDAPENTLVSAKLAWKNRADAVELDIRPTKDNGLVVIHDADTKRTTGVAGKIEEMTLAQIQALDAGSWKGAKFAGEKIPTFDEFLAIIPEGGKLLVELKSDERIVAGTKAAVDRSGKKPEQIVFISSSKEALAAAKKLMPQHRVVWIRNYHVDKATGKATQTIEEVIATAKELGFDGIDLKAAWPIDAALVKKVKEAGLTLYVWTVDDPAVARKLVEAGVDGITTNRAGWLRAQLGL